MKCQILFYGKKIRKLETICMKCQILFSGKSKNIFQNVVCLNFYPGYVNGHYRFDWTLQDELKLTFAVRMFLKVRRFIIARFCCSLQFNIYAPVI